ncbi:MAG: glycosyltransferase family A protein [Candidatus Nanoarchaeia archaeon]|nr:glycosyltransferase family A protein [Candidatus Nanoarchaeia archaeon]
MKKIAAIMPCFLGDYPGAASNREFKLTRAVNSFLCNDYKDKLLIIVSDGCEKTNWMYRKQMSGHREIHLVKINKQPLFSGNVRQAGIDYAKKLGVEIIAYLDSDDIIYPFHLRAISEQIGLNDWVYFNDFLCMDAGIKKVGLRTVELKLGSAGTSAIAHRLIDGAGWDGCDNYGHDWTFIQKLMLLSDKYSKLPKNYAGYVVMHYIPLNQDF